MMWWWMFWCTMNHSNHHHCQNHYPSQAPHGDNDRRVPYLQLPWRLSITTTRNMNRKVINTLVRTGTVVVPKIDERNRHQRAMIVPICKRPIHFRYLTTCCLWNAKMQSFKRSKISFKLPVMDRNTLIASSMDIYVDTRLRNETKYISLSWYDFKMSLFVWLQHS